VLEQERGNRGYQRYHQRRSLCCRKQPAELASEAIAVRRKIAEAYQHGLSGSFVETAKLFGVSEATVNRLNRLIRLHLICSAV